MNNLLPHLLSLHNWYLLYLHNWWVYWSYSYDCYQTNSQNCNIESIVHTTQLQNEWFWPGAFRIPVFLPSGSFGGGQYWSVSLQYFLVTEVNTFARGVSEPGAGTCQGQYWRLLALIRFAFHILLPVGGQSGGGALVQDFDRVIWIGNKEITSNLIRLTDISGGIWFPPPSP